MCKNKCKNKYKLVSRKCYLSYKTSGETGGDHIIGKRKILVMRKNGKL